jgi:hypothetical protein
MDAGLLAICNDWLWLPKRVIIDEVPIKGMAGDGK